MDMSTKIDLVLKALTLIVASTSAFYAFIQYRKGQRWKSHDIAAAQLEKLTSDPEIALACQSLDWGGVLSLSRKNIVSYSERQAQILCKVQ